MYVRVLVWDGTNVEHIARHNVSPEEVDEVCSDEDALFTRVGRRRYQVIGQTSVGRYLTVFLDHLGRGSFYPVTARPSDGGERRLFRRLRRR